MTLYIKNVIKPILNNIIESNKVSSDNIEMKLKLQVISDLHLEFRDPKKGYDFLKPSAPILVLAGDVCVLGTAADFKKYEKFIEYFYDKYEYIIHVPGNHEYYTNPGKNAKNQLSMKQIDEKMKEYTQWYPKLHYLNNSIFKLNYQNKLYYFIGTTMWTKITKDYLEYVQESMNDYVYITVGEGSERRSFTTQDALLLHRKATGFIKRAIDRAKQDKAIAIVITHHKPYDSDEKSELSIAYEVDMKKLIQDPVKAWIYGHTHLHDDVKMGGARIVNNGKGYLNSRGSGYIPGFCIDL